jgi:Dolichyl-phosphate-mannose-protein mannosyltransferase
MKVLEKNLVSAFFEKISARAFFLLLFVYQLVFIFQGLDFADEGFHATFYQEIYHDPASVQYNFMFWLSGIIGGAWLKLFSGLGLWGIRLAGVLVTTGTIIACYNFLKRYLNPTYLKLGLLLVTLFNSNDPKEIYYNNLSTLFYVITAWLLFKGLKDKKLLYLILSGVMVSVNTFTRLTNLAELCLALVIIYYGILYQVKPQQVIKQVIVFGLGFLVGTAGLLLLMKLMGHLDLFLNSMNLIVKLGQSKQAVGQVVKSQDSSNYYGLMNQIKMFWGSYSISFRYVALTGVLVLVLATGLSYARKFVRANWLFTAFKAFLLIALAAVLISGSKLNNTPNIIVLYFFTGFSLLMTAFILLTNNPKDLKVLALMGCLITLTYPIGSSSGILTAGIYSFWLSIPITLNHFLGLRSFTVKSLWNYEANAAENQSRILIREDQFREVKRWGLVLCILGCLYSAYYYPMHNASERVDMRYSVNTNKLRFIYTNKERADAVNELLAASKNFVQPGDKVLAYDAMPMFHYLTETRPFTGNSYPWLYQVEVLQQKLDEALALKEKLPVIVRQRVVTNGWRGKNWPVNKNEDYADWNDKRNLIIDSLISTYHYKNVWQSHAFEIFVPE